MGRPIAVGIVSAALSLALPLASLAAGLGKLTVLSPLGQPLNAEIEIVSLQAGEEEGLGARLATPDAFRQAGVDYNSALSGMRFSVQRRDGRPYVRVTSTQPVNEPFLDMLVELQWNTGRLVREYTFLLDPVEYKPSTAVAAAPPAPKPEAPAAAPAPRPVEEKPLAPTPTPTPTPAAAPVAPAAPGTTYEVKKGDTLAKIAREHMAPGVSLNQMLTAIYRANEDAFIRNNINLVRQGRILNIPSETSGVEAEEADQLVRSHMSEFSDYRKRLAAAPAAAEAGAAGQRAVTGRIEGKPPAVPAESPDQLRLSKAEPGKAGSTGARAAREDDRVAQQRAAKEAESRVAELEKNVADLQKLLALKNQQLAEVEKNAAKPAPQKPAAEAPKPAAEAPKPAAAPAPQPAAEAPKPAAEAPKPAAEAPKPAAEAPKPPAAAPKAAAKAPPAAKKGPPPPEPSIIDEFLDNPLYLGLAGLVVLLLIGYGWWTWRRKKATQVKFQTSVLGASTGAAAGSSLASPAAPAAATAVSAAAAAPAAASLEPEEVDPIAEADVYMAYGRDAQAEEILKEALQKDPNRVPVHAKLLEIYANRRDAKSFEQTALKLKGLTNGAGPEWEKAAALGRSVDPQNGVYGTGDAAAAPAAAPAAPAAAPTLDFDLGGAAAQTAAPDIALDAAPSKEAASVDFDLGGATTPPPAAAPAPAAAAEPASIDFDLGAPAAPAAEKKSDFTPEGTVIMKSQPADQTSSGGLDFDLGLGDTKKPEAAPAAPTAPAAPAPAADSGGGLDFDLNLDLGSPAEKPAEEKPAAAAAPAAPAGDGGLALDLSGISLDLGTPEPAAAAPAGGGDAKWQEVATKLDLAKAYEEMGDKDGARELLNEVMKDGDAAQKGQAEQLLAKLA